VARVVLIVSAFPKLSESFLFGKFRGLREAGWDVSVVCKRSDSAEWNRFGGVDASGGLRRRVRVAWPQRRRWLAAALLPAAVIRCLARNPRGTWRYLRGGGERVRPGVFRRLYLDAELVCAKPDVIHFEFGPMAVGRMHLGRVLGCKTVVSFRGYDLNAVGLSDPDYYREVWEQADTIHFLGEDLWRRARERGCPPGKEHVLIPPAIDESFFDPRAAGGRDPATLVAAPGLLSILSVGRLDWRKGYEHALSALRRLKDRGVPLEYRIVGDGDYLEAVAFARHQLGLDEEVTLLGARPKEEVRDEMLRADVFLHPAVSEGFSNAVLEAQAMELPVVCTDAGGLPENVADGESGFVVPRRDPTALAERLETLARDPALRRRMGEAGRRRVMARFRLTEQVAAFGELYQRLVEGRRPGRTEGSDREVRAVPAS